MECSKKQKKSTRSSKGCWTCRNRKIRCDLKRESCNNCLNANLKCEGYFSKLNWYELQTIPEDFSAYKPKVIKMPTSNSRSFVPFVKWGIQQYHFEDVLDNDIYFNLGPFNSWQLNVHDNNEKLLTLNVLSEDRKLKTNSKSDQPSQLTSNNSSYNTENDSKKSHYWIDFSLFDNYLITKIFEECNFRYISYLNTNIITKENKINIEKNESDAPSLSDSISYFVKNFNNCHALIFDIFEAEIVSKISRFGDRQGFDSLWGRIFQNWIRKSIDLTLILKNLSNIKEYDTICANDNEVIPTLLGFQIIMISNYYKFLKYKEKESLIFAIHVQNILSKLKASQSIETLLLNSQRYILDVFIYELLHIHIDAILAINIQVSPCFNAFVLLISKIKSKDLDESFFFPTDELLFEDICTYFEALILLYDTTSTISDTKNLNYTVKLQKIKSIGEAIKETSNHSKSTTSIKEFMDRGSKNCAGTQYKTRMKKENNMIEDESSCQSPTLNEIIRPKVESKITVKDDTTTAGSGDIHYDYEFDDEIDDPIPPELEIKFTFGSGPGFDSAKYPDSDEETDLQNNNSEESHTLISVDQITSGLERNLCNFPSCLIFDFQYRIVCLLQKYKSYHMQVSDELNTVDDSNTRNSIIYQYNNSVDSISSLEHDLETWNCPWDLRRSLTDEEDKSLPVERGRFLIDENEFHSNKCMSYYLKTKVFYDGLMLLFFTQIKDMPQDCLTPYINEILQLACSNLNENKEKTDSVMNKHIVANSSMFLSLPIFLAASELGSFDISDDFTACEEAKKSHAELQMKTKMEIFDAMVSSYWRGDVLYCNWKAIQIVYEIWRRRSQSLNCWSSEEKADISWELVLRELGFSILLL